MTLRDLDALQPLYFLPEDDVVSQALVPAFAVATEFRGMIGFFNSHAFRELAPGLAEFIQRSTGQIRLIISPYLSQDDQAALRSGVMDPRELVERRLSEIYGEARIDENSLIQHTLKCLSYLISVNRIDIKVAIVGNGLFHPKVWLFTDQTGHLVLHGSSNATAAGLTTNVEHLALARSWGGFDQEDTVNRLAKEFEAIWADKKPAFMKTYDLPSAMGMSILRDFPVSDPPAAEDFWSLWHHEKDQHTKLAVNEPERQPGREFKFDMPPNLEYQSGDFAHQGTAVKAWESAQRRGILEMATGSGKTVTSLIAAHRLFENQGQLLFVIAVPYLPLVTQWAAQVRRFNVEPSVPGSYSSREQKISTVQRQIRSLRLGLSKVECLVVTHDLLCDPVFQTEIARFQGPSLLIADEVHDLGTPRFLAAPPETFSFRLGLSATPIRQYDQEGTQALLDYFGDVVFRFTLEEAIGKCLVPYDYFLHPVTLTRAEMDEWIEATAKLRAMGWRTAEGAERDAGRIPATVQRQLIRRRRVLEQASEKLTTLEEVIGKGDTTKVKHTLVYCSDKGREQLRQVNNLLMHKLNMRIHQVTQDESGNPDLTQSILQNFANADGIQVLTAMRVLDEGVDIPEVSTAYIMASTTVERQWVQRRGRVLRKCEATQKQSAEIHDFLVIPPEVGPTDTDISTILKTELSRIMAFAKISRNFASSTGALQTIKPIVNRYF